MKDYLSIFTLKGTESNQLEQIRFILANLFIFFLPYNQFYSTLVLYLLLLTTLIDLKKYKFKQIPKQFWIFQLVFGLSIVGYLYSQHPSQAGLFVQRQLVIVLFPLLLPLAFKITEKRIKSLLDTLSITSVVVVLLLFTYAFHKIYLLDLPIPTIYSRPFLNHNFTAPIGTHASYLSAYLALSFVYLLSRLFQNNSLNIKILHIISMLIILTGLLFLAARAIIFYTAFISILIFPLFYLEKRRKIRYFIISACFLLLSFFFFKDNSYLNNRFWHNSLVDLGIVESSVGLNKSEPRASRWKMGLQLVKEAPIIGYGTADEIPQLKKKYKKNNFVVSYVKSFNSHNEYLSILIKHGIVGLLIFIFAFGYYFRLAIKNKDFIYLAFLIGLAFFFLVENVLDRQKGIFFFAFFNTVFGYYQLKQLKIVPNSKNKNKLSVT